MALNDGISLITQNAHWLAILALIIFGIWKFWIAPNEWARETRYWEKLEEEELKKNGS